MNLKRLLSSFLITALLFSNAWAASISTLSDNFNDNSIDTAKWDTYGTATIVEANGQLEETTLTEGVYSGVVSVSTYDLTSSATTVKIIDAGNQALASYYFVPLTVSTSPDAGSNYNYWYIKEGTLGFADKNDTTLASTVYNSSVHKYLKIRESSGITYADYSTDGINWTNFASLANDINVTAVYVFPIGIYSTLEASTTTAKVDDFNILPSATAPLFRDKFGAGIGVGIMRGAR